MNITSREALWVVMGFSMVLMAGCSTEEASLLPKTDGSKTVQSPQAPAPEEHMAYAPDPKPKDTQVKSAPKVQTNRDDAFGMSERLKPVYFGLNRSKLSDEAMSIAKENAIWIKAQPPYLLEIAGVSDSRGSLAKNRLLAKRRAESLKAFYVAEGIPAERIRLATQDAEDCVPMTEDCLKLSRRAETLIEEKAVFAQK